MYQNWDDAYREEFNYNDRSENDVLDNGFVAKVGDVWYAYESQDMVIDRDTMEECYGIKYTKLKREDFGKVIELFLNDYFDLDEEFDDKDWCGLMVKCDEDYQPEYDYYNVNRCDGIVFCIDIKVKCTMCDGYVDCKVIE